LTGAPCRCYSRVDMSCPLRILISLALIILGLTLGWWMARVPDPGSHPAAKASLQTASSRPPLPRDLPWLKVINDSTIPVQTREQLMRLNSTTRSPRQMPDRVMKVLAIQPGQVVADVGCGSGYFTFRFARAVGARGRVYGVDVDITAIEMMMEQIRQYGTTNVFLVMTHPDDLGLPPNCLDLAFLCEVHTFSAPGRDSRPANLLYTSIRRSLKAEGRLAVIEQRVNIAPENIIWGLRRSGFQLLSRHDFLPDQNFLIFRKATTGESRHPDQAPAKTAAQEE